MARPPLPLGTWGTITTEKVRDGSYRALTRFCDHDGNTRRVTATGPSKAAAERALRDILGTRTAPAGELLTAETRLIDLATSGSPVSRLKDGSNRPPSTSTAGCWTTWCYPVLVG